MSFMQEALKKEHTHLRQVRCCFVCAGASKQNAAA